MSKVHILSADLISKIAAGEVVERPASALKELLENSLDAGATDIRLDLEDAGKKFLGVRDNGSGIERDDLEKIFLRHSTSKIQSIDDLYNIQSLGFRGEALYSIAAVSDVTLRSRPAHEEMGMQIHVRAGESLDLRPVAMSPGTEIEVRELFFNTPARRKFLKSNITEARVALNTVIPYALLDPQRRVQLTHQKKTLLELIPDEDRKSRIAHTLNLNEKFLLEVQHDLPESKISMAMILGDINIKRARRDLQFMFINGRPVQSRSLNFHINQIYQLIFPPNSYPFFCLFIQMPPQEVDVNVHPTKREVKLREEAALCSLVRYLTEKTLMSQGQPKQVSVSGMSIHRSGSELSWQEEQKKIDGDFLQRNLTNSLGKRKETWEGSLFGDSLRRAKNLKEKLEQAHFLGQFLKKFLLFESGSHLLVIDQHAAQERITFELLKKQYESGHLEVQPFLTPLLVGLTPAEMLAFEEACPALEAGGLTCTQFDPCTVAVHSSPPLLTNPELALRQFLDDGKFERFDHTVLARQACRSSIMAGNPLQKEQAQYQQRQLLHCQDPFTCPHGRPTVIEITENFLDRQFLRT